MTDQVEASSLENAPEHIKLAVDLLYLLESNDISPKTALAALEIVRSDLQIQQKAGN